MVWLAIAGLAIGCFALLLALQIDQAIDDLRKEFKSMVEELREKVTVLGDVSTDIETEYELAELRERVETLEDRLSRR